MDEFRKSFEATIDDVNPGSREVVAVISSDAVDRDGEVLMPRGLRKKNYAGVVVDLNHNHDNPIGTTKWVKAESNRVLAKYRISDKTELARNVFGLIQDGILRYHSVEGRGFSSGKPTADDIKINKGWGSAKRLIREWELFGFAVCAQPVNPDAVALMVSKGYNPKTIETIAGRAVEAVKQAIQQPAEAVARSLTTGEAYVALSKAIATRMEGISVDQLLARAFARASGKID